MRARVARSARKHKVSVSHIRAMLALADDPTVVGDSLRYVGRDDRGIELEVVIVPDDRNDDGWVVIHAMPTEFRRKR